MQFNEKPTLPAQGLYSNTMAFLQIKAWDCLNPKWSRDTQTQERQVSRWICPRGGSLHHVPRVYKKQQTWMEPPAGRVICQGNESCSPDSVDMDIALYLSLSPWSVTVYLFLRSHQIHGDCGLWGGDLERAPRAFSKLSMFVH
jgi:hypothetical protein